MLRRAPGANVFELPQTTRFVILPASILSLTRTELVEWKPSFGYVGGVCRVEKDNGEVVLHALSSGETRSLSDINEINDAFEWAREELLSSFEGKASFLVFDPLGPEIVMGEGLDSALKATTWKETEDARHDDIEKALFILVVSEDVLIDVVLDMYKLDEKRTVVYRSDFESFKESASKWYERSHSRFLMRRVKRRAEQLHHPESDEDEVSGHFYTALRFPLLAGVLLLIGLELLLYTALLQIVVFYETATRAHRSTRRALEAVTHEKSWRRLARKLDNLEGKSGGSLPELSLAKNFSIRLERALKQVQNGDIERGKDEIIRCLFEITAPDAVHKLLPEGLYTQNYTGRNQEAAHFVRMVEKAIAFVAESANSHHLPSNLAGVSPRSLALVRNIDPGVPVDSNTISRDEERTLRNENEKRKVLAELHRAYGVTALCLSGGASNAFFHLGVVRTLLGQGILPKHISGASGGALVGAFVATHTDDELRNFLDNPALLSRIFDPCSGAGWAVLVKNLLTRPSVFDPEEWAEKLKSKVCGTLTFQEAYVRTGRSLTIMVFNGKNHTRAMNHKTAPDICIFSAVLASSAIPKLLPAIQLLRKTKSGEIVPFTAWGPLWRDGSFEEELPFDALSRVFNASFFIVSQVNPHIAPFFFDNRGTAGRVVQHRGGRGWRGGFLSSFLERVLKQDMKKWLHIVDEFKLLPPIFETDISRIFLGQSFGDITLVPPIRFCDYLNLASDPNTAKKMNHYLITGARMTFPKLATIEDRIRIELALEKHMALLSDKVMDMGRIYRSRSQSSINI